MAQDMVFVNKLLTEVFRTGLAEVVEDGKPVMQTKLPADPTEELPLIVARSGAGSELDARFGADFATVIVDVYADNSTGTGEDVAQKWASWARNELLAAWEWQRTFPSGHVSSFESTNSPANVDDAKMPDQVTRYLATYRIGVRPPP